MSTPIDVERRRTRRRLADPEEPISRVRLRTGRELSVVDVSDAGALVEGPVRLLPGTHVDVHVVTRDGRLLVRSRVSRCSVASVKADAVCYRGVLVFERQIDTANAGYAVPVVPPPDAGVQGPDYPADRQFEST